MNTSRYLQLSPGYPYVSTPSSVEGNFLPSGRLRSYGAGSSICSRAERLEADCGIGVVTDCVDSAYVSNSREIGTLSGARKSKSCAALLPGSPVARLLKRVSGTVDISLIPMTANQHHSYWKAIDHSAGYGHRRMLAYIECAGISQVHVGGF